MATKTNVTRFTTATSTGTQDITIADFGTPQLAIFLFNGDNSTADGVTDHAIIGIGTTDGTRQWSTLATEENGQGANDGGRDQNATRCITIVDGNTVVQARATFDSWITNGIRINWDANSLSTGVLVTCVLIGGATNVHVNWKPLGSIVNSAVNITDPGFEPDFVLFTCTGNATLNSNTTYGMLSFGFGINDVDVTQKCVGWGTPNGATTMAYGMQVFSNRVATQTYSVGTSWAAELSDFDANGFSLTSRIAGAGNDYVFYIAVETEKDVWVDSIDSPTSTGSRATTGVGLEPDCVFMVETMVQTEDSFISDGDAGGYAISIFDDTNEFCHGFATEDNVGTSNTESGLDNIAVHYNKDDGTDAFDAVHSSMDSGGWTLNYSNADGTTRKFIAFAIGTAGGVGSPLTAGYWQPSYWTSGYCQEDYWQDYVVGGLGIPIAQHHYKMLSNQ